MALFATQMWADTYADVYTNPASASTLAGNENGKGAFSVITPAGGVSFGNSALQINSNGGSGTFTIASIDGSYITSISFTSQSSYPINTLTSDDGNIVKNGDVYTFTPTSATLTSASFSMSAQSNKKVRVAPITVNLTSDHSYLSMNFGVSSGTVSCTKSSGASDLVITTTGSASSNRLSFGSGKTLTFTSAGHDIASIHFTFDKHADGANITANTGTFSGSSWTPTTSVQSVTFSTSSSNTIGAISVKLEEHINYYTLSFDANGHGTAPDPIENIESGDKPAAPAAPSETGWIFGGWNNKADGTGEDWVWGTSAVTKDTTLYAKWTEDPNVDKYSVTYILNGAPGIAPTQDDAAEDVEITLADEPSWDGHTFLGWNDGTDTYDAGESYTMPDADVEFTAQWCTNITPTLSYNYSIVYPSFGVAILPTIEGNTGSGEVSYASSNNSIATVDAETGEVTPVAVGSVTITATIAAAGDYCGNTAQATIKVVAAPTHLIQNNLNVTSGDWESVILTSNTAKITTLKEWQIADGQDRTAGVTDKQSIKNNRTHGIGTTSAKVDAYYMYLSFQIAEGYELTLSAVNIPVFGISADKTTEVEIADNASHKITVNGTITKDSDGNGFGTYDFSKSPKLSGIVTLKMWAYGATSGYRMKSPLYLDGTITVIPTALDNTEAGVKAVKRLENGMLVIEKNGVRYNAQGQIIR